MWRGHHAPYDPLAAMPPSLQAFIVIFVVGTLLRSRAVLTQSHAQRLATFVFSVSLPATILVSLDRVDLAPTAWKLPLAACFITLPMIMCSWRLARLLQLPRERQGGFVLATGSINSVFFAFPVILATFGDEGLTQAVLFDLGQTTLTLTVLYGLAVWHGTESATPRSAAIRFLSSPPLWALACILAVKLSGYRLHPWLLEILEPLHLTTTPLASLALGLSISLSAVRRTAQLATLGVAMRMGGGLLLGLSAAWLLGLTEMERAVVILVAAMPSAVSSVIFAAETRLDEELVASIVALSICLGMVILPWLPSLATMLLN
jgi:malate permease and related proteins